MSKAQDAMDERMLIMHRKRKRPSAKANKHYVRVGTCHSTKRNDDTNGNADDDDNSNGRYYRCRHEQSAKKATTSTGTRYCDGAARTGSYCDVGIALGNCLLCFCWPLASGDLPGAGSTSFDHKIPRNIMHAAIINIGAVLDQRGYHRHQ